MTKSKKAVRRSGAGERKAEVAPAIFWAPSAAGTRVFAIEELTRSILHHIPEILLLSKFQRICRQWRAIALEPLQPLLDGAPPSPRSHRYGRVINPLLLKHFGKILSGGDIQLEIGLWLTGEHYWRMRSLIDLPIATCGPGRLVHDAYARVGASWRNMQIYHPPVYELRYRRDPAAEAEIIPVADGVRLGQVYDVLVAITSKTKGGTAWYEARVTWPQASARDNSGSEADSADGDRDRTVRRDYILVERVRHVFPDSCVCAYGPYSPRRCRCEYGERTRILQRIASNKWRVASEELKKENLLVRI